jgi:hypothetical protein
LGEIVVRVRQEISSTGELEETVQLTPGKLDVPPCVPRGKANSFFDVFLEIETGAQTGRSLDQGLVELLHTATPIQLESTVTSQDPLDGGVYQGSITGEVELLREDDTPSGIQLVEGVQVSNVNLFLPLIQSSTPQ